MPEEQGWLQERTQELASPHKGITVDRIKKTFPGSLSSFLEGFSHPVTWQGKPTPAIVIAGHAMVK